MQTLKRLVLAAYLLVLLVSEGNNQAAADDIFLEIDADGVPSYSDQNTPGSSPVDVRPVTPYSDPNPQYRPDRSEPTKSPATSSTINYDARITDPVDDSAIRNNAGALNLTITIEPTLAPDHDAQLLMDGKVIRPISSSGVIGLNNLDRGTHAFSIRITGPANKVIFDGPATRITVLRHSILHRAG